MCEVAGLRFKSWGGGVVAEGLREAWKPDVFAQNYVLAIYHVPGGLTEPF